MYYTGGRLTSGQLTLVPMIEPAVKATHNNVTVAGALDLPQLTADTIIAGMNPDSAEAMMRVEDMIDPEQGRRIDDHRHHHRS